MLKFLNGGFFRSKYWLRKCTVMSVVLLLAGCSWFSSDEQDPDAAVVLSPLEVPPDLVRPYKADKLVAPVPAGSPKQTLQSKKSADCRCDDRPPSIGERVLPQGKGVQRLRDGQHRWLLVSAEPEQVWPLARKFLEMRGYRVNRDEPAVGLMETDWKNIFVDKGENADAGNGNTDGIPTWRERLRLRLEPGKQSERTEVYITQYRSERVAGAKSGEQWKLRQSDDERSIEMLNRFARFLTAENVEDAVSLAPVASKLGSDGDGGSVLIVEAEFAKVWRRTGIALDALGFVIDDRDRNSRIYSVYNELSTGKTEEELQHGKPESATVRENYRIRLDQKGETTVLSIRTKTGQVDNSDVAVHVLNLLHGQFQ